MMRGGWHTFVGMNIKGTPAMKIDQVRHDLAVLQELSDVAVVQEFKWPWYWRAARHVAGKHWRSAPGLAVGAVRSVYAAQAVLWDGRVWKRKKVVSALLHAGTAGISEDRYLRAALLKERGSGRGARARQAWFATTHFVVGGDMKHDPARRRQIMAQDLERLDLFLTRLLANSSHPVIFQADLNLRPGSDCWDRFKAIVDKHHGRILGEPGVEFLVVFQNPAKGSTHVDVSSHFRVPVSELETDHEGRGFLFRLVR